MARGKQLAVVGNQGSKYRNIHEVLQNPSEKTKLQNYIDEAVRCKGKIYDQQESIKTLRSSAVDELNIEPKMFMTLVSLFFNNNFDQKKEEIEKIELAIDALIGTTALPSTRESDN